jgi:hypothetical protein
LFSSTPYNWTSYIKWSFIWRWVNARHVLITEGIWKSVDGRLYRHARLQGSNKS